MATVQTAVGEQHLSEHIYVVDLTTIQPGQSLDIDVSGSNTLSGCVCAMVSHNVRVAPTSKDPVEVRHIAGSDSTSGNTVRVQVDTIPGGDLAGATVRVFLHFITGRDRGS
jgi:hypothetical protein